MKHKMFFLLLMVAFMAVPTMAQSEETGEVVYVDSVDAFTRMVRHPIASRKVIAKSGANDTIWSREKKFLAVVEDPYGYKSEGILHCIRMAMDCWESKIEITDPISITFMFNDQISPDVEIKTTVKYSRGAARMSIPSSLYYQGQGIGRKLMEYVRRRRSSLSLRAYAQNEKALCFYRRLGFKIVSENIEAQTGTPEVLLIWSRGSISGNRKRFPGDS